MPDALVMLKWGDDTGFKFSIQTAAYQELERAHAWRWAKMDRLNAKPSLQFVGPDSERITMRGAIYPAFAPQNAGLQQLPKLRAIADRGETHALVDGLGRVWGEYAVETIRETQRVFFSDGTPRCVEFEIVFVEDAPKLAPALIPVQTPTFETIKRADIATQVAGLTPAPKPTLKQ